MNSPPSKSPAGGPGWGGACPSATGRDEYTPSACVTLSNADFAAALYRDIAPSDHGTLHSVAGDPKDAKGWPAQPWAPGKRLPTLNPFANNYVCVSSFHPTLSGEFYRRKILFSALHCVMIDDLGTKLPKSDLRLEPSALIETSPGNFQAWLFLVEPITSLPMAETLIDQLIRRGITADDDPGMRGVTRVARLPVGSNGKVKYRSPTGAVWQQRVAAANLELRYTPERIAEVYGLDLTPPRRTPPAPRPRKGVDPEHALLIEQLRALGMHINELREGYHAILCPWSDQHSDRGKSGTYYMEPNAENSWRGGFQCHHGHCAERDINDLIGWMRTQVEIARDIVNENTRRIVQMHHELMVADGYYLNDAGKWMSADREPL